jgi:hypothetical protein
MTWVWLALAAYWVATCVYAWRLRGRYPDWPLIPIAIMAVSWPYFAWIRIMAASRSRRASQW